MSLDGHIENGVVIFEQPVSLANGTPVRVEVVSERSANLHADLWGAVAVASKFC